MPAPYDSHLHSLPDEGDKDAWNLRGTFSLSVGVLAAAIIPLFAIFVRYSDTLSYSEEVALYYQWFLDVEVMIFLGFGFLMTFLRRYSYSAVAFNFFVSAFVMIYGILVIGGVQQMWWGGTSGIVIDIPLMIDAAFAAGSAMIAFGAVLGKATPTQMLWLTAIMIPIYAVNQQVAMSTFKAFDVGGSITIHAFGAYYGLSASLMLSRKHTHYTSVNTKNAGSYTSDLFAMLGTLFLWIYWPSFNGALASYPVKTEIFLPAAMRASQFHCVVNTVLALLGSAFAAFGASSLLENKFNMVHIQALCRMTLAMSAGPTALNVLVQNASLAGGVAIGSAANLNMTPAGALMVGLAAGTISTLGFFFLSPLLEEKAGLGDTCGVHNLHGIPGLLGGLVAGVSAWGQDASLLSHSTYGATVGWQCLAVLVTLTAASVSGTLAGAIVSTVNPAKQHLGPHQLFDDGAFWTEVEVEDLPDDFEEHATLHHRLNAGGGDGSEPLLA